MKFGNDRYYKHLLLKGIGNKGQECLSNSSVLIIGCGALGSVQSQLLARAGVGKILIVDPDIPEEMNLHRQILFDEQDVSSKRTKVEIAVQKLTKINSTIEIKGINEAATASNIEKLITGVDLVLDGTDNFETRYLINDACVKHNKPWIYGGVVGTTGITMTILPHIGPCLRCILPYSSGQEKLPSPETEGILSLAPLVIASIQTTEAIKYIVGAFDNQYRLLKIDLWQGSFKYVTVSKDKNCPCCGKGIF